jgi:hypothetical protein
MSEFNLETYLQQLNMAPDIENCEKVPIPPIMADQNYIFISYSHKDYKSVYADLAHLYCRGVRFWYDRGLSAGEDWEREVQEHIQDPHCCGVIFYISTNMFLSDSVFKEIEFTKTKKRPSIILQKNYFCVNLETCNISDMLFSVQEIQRQKGLKRLDTKKLNVLTATFSDDDTYINFTGQHHVDDLVEQIQRKFDVTSPADSSSLNELALGSIKNPRLALFAFMSRETEPVPLFRFLYSDFQKTKRLRPWYLVVLGIVAGMISSLAMLYRICTVPEIPVFSELSISLNVTAFAVMSVVWSLAFVPYVAAKCFWLFYISPVRKRREEGTPSRVALCLIYFCLTAVLALFSAPICLIAMGFAYSVVDQLKPLLDRLGLLK